MGFNFPVGNVGRIASVLTNILESQGVYHIL